MANIQGYGLRALLLSFEVPTKAGARTREAYRQFRKAVGGFNPKSKTLTPMTWDADNHTVSVYLDSITGAVESGILDDEKWPQQLFKSPADLDSFLAVLSDYDDEYRINDRWWFALSQLAQVYEEAGFIRTADIAGELVVRITEIKDQQEAATKSRPKAKTLDKKTGVKAVPSKKTVTKKLAAKKNVATKAPAKK